MMFIVGIDVAKRSHEVSIITSEGQTVQRAFSISNNCTGYNCLIRIPCFLHFVLLTFT